MDRQVLLKIGHNPMTRMGMPQDLNSHIRQGLHSGFPFFIPKCIAMGLTLGIASSCTVEEGTDPVKIGRELSQETEVVNGVAGMTVSLVIHQQIGPTTG